MPELMKIGEFAKHCDTTVATVLHYERMGLLIPSETRGNGYRYYDSTQTYRFVSVRAMVDAGFSLSNAKELLDGRDYTRFTAAAKEGVSTLKARIAELKSSLVLLSELEKQAAMASDLVFDELREIELSNIWLVDIGAQKSGTSPEFAEDRELVAADYATIDRLMSISPVAGAAPYGLTSSGPVDDGPVVYDSMFYLLRDEKLARKAQARPLPGGPYACIAHRSRCEELGPTHAALIDYVAERGGNPDATRYEVSAFRFFDTMSAPGDDDYACIVLMPLAPRS